MPLSSRDQPFRAFVTAHRPRLLACAWLLTGDPERAERLVEATLASVYEAWPRTSDPVTAAYERLVSGGSGVVPWRGEERVQLRDTRVATAATVPLVRDLDEVDIVPRQLFVLQRVAGLPIGQAARILDLPPGQAPALALAAWAALVERNPRRADDAALADELQGAVAALWVPATDAAEDVAHGRILVRRGRVRAALVLAAVVALGALIGSQLSGAQEQRVGRAPVRAPTATTQPRVPSFSPPPTGPPVTCDTRELSCRTRALRDWRRAMAEVTSLHLDPRDRYFNAVSYGYSDAYETPSFWTGGPGALGVDLIRDRRGATQVFVQIATSRQAAVKCGALTRQRCSPIRFMDGNWYLLTETTTPAQGIEVQHRPYGDQVITIVVRNVAGGQPLAVTRGDVLQLVQDDRLRLPRL